MILMVKAKLSKVKEKLSHALFFLVVAFAVLGRNIDEELLMKLEWLAVKLNVPVAFLIFTIILTVSALLMFVRSKTLFYVVMFCWIIILISFVISTW